jgi:hypothetical protein
MRKHVTYANVIATICLFVVLGGTSVGSTVVDATSSATSKLATALKLSKRADKNAAAALKLSKQAAARIGPTGPAGPAGKNGQNGANGKDGKDGKDGINGAGGPAGVTGPTGPTGPAGPILPGGAPKVEITGPADGAVYPTAGATVFIVTKATDPDDDPLTYTWTDRFGDRPRVALASEPSSPNGEFFLENGVCTGDLHHITVTVDDGNGHSVTDDLTVNVNNC